MYIVYIVPVYLMSVIRPLRVNCLFKMRGIFYPTDFVIYITVHQVILEFTSSSPANNLKLLLNAASFLTWHNSVQVRHIVDAIVCQFTVAFAQHLQDLRPQSLLYLRKPCQLVQGETQSTTRSLVTP